MLQPKRTRYRRPHRIKYEGKTKGGSTVVTGEYGIKALEGAWITNRQIEAVRVAMTRCMKRTGDVIITIFPHLSLTRKPLEVRMGSGKGAPEIWVAVVKEGRIMFEIKGVSEEIARQAFELARHKLPIKCKFVKRGEEND